MRIIGGKWRGRRLAAPEGRAVRPTIDRVRESLFNVIEHGRHTNGDGSLLPGVRVLDGFAGTGALGLEALSRDAAHVTFIDSDRAALAVLEANIAELGAAAETTVLRADCLTPPRATEPCGLILLDPPYGQGLAEPALQALDAQGWIAPGALCVVELRRDDAFEPPDGFEPLDDRHYGATRIVLLRRAP